MCWKFSFSLSLTTLLLVALASSDDSKDKQECAESLVGLATCLAYVGGDARTPTPDCCSGLKQLLKTNKKCLCVVIKDRNDPDLGLNINVSRALGLPEVCNAPANISQCPALLNLPPNSPDARIFYQNGPKPDHTIASGPVAGAPTSAPLRARARAGAIGATTGGTARSNSGSTNGGGCGKDERMLGMEITCGLVVLLWALSM